MSEEKPIAIGTNSNLLSSGFVAPTPQNTPLTGAPIAQGLSKPTVPDIVEEDDKEGSDDDDEEEASDEDDEVDTAAAIQATMLGMVQGKLAGLIGKSSGYIEGLPLSVRKRVEGVKGIHTDFMKLELEYKKEIMELDRKYSLLYKPLFEKRFAVLEGTTEPTEDEVNRGVELTKKEDKDADPLAEKKKDSSTEDDVKGIPEFWLTALRNHTDISMLIEERDEAALRSLSDIRLTWMTDKPGYIISFHFKPNEFFSNDVLNKTYYFKEELEYAGEWIYDHSEGMKIDWKGDKDLTHVTEVRKQRNKATNRTRIVRKAVKTPSFFDFFSPPVAPSAEALAGMSEEEQEEIESRLEIDYQVAEDLKERVIPRAIDYFTGKAMEYDGLPSDDDDEGFEDEDEDEDDGEDSDDSENKFVPPPKKSAGKAGGKGDPDCKNQ